MHGTIETMPSPEADDVCNSSGFGRRVGVTWFISKKLGQNGFITRRDFC